MDSLLPVVVWVKTVILVVLLKMVPAVCKPPMADVLVIAPSVVEKYVSPLIEMTPISSVLQILTSVKR